MHQMSSGSLRPRSSNCGSCRIAAGTASDPFCTRSASSAVATVHERSTFAGATRGCRAETRHSPCRPRAWYAFCPADQAIRAPPRPSASRRRCRSRSTSRAASARRPHRTRAAWHGRPPSLRARRPPTDRRPRNRPSCRRRPYERSVRRAASSRARARRETRRGEA